MPPTCFATSNRSSSDCSNATWPRPRNGSPHEYVPYSRGRDAVVGEQWNERDADLAGATIDEAVRSALLVNLLTEDNLPYYFRTIERIFGPDGAWGTWASWCPYA